MKLKHDAAKIVKRITAEAKETADKEAKRIMAIAMQRYAGDYVAERTVSVVQLPDDEMKGRIIGLGRTKHSGVRSSNRY